MPGAQFGGGGGGMVRLVIAALIAFVTMCSYYTSTQKNPITGKNERVSMSIPQEVQLGLQMRDEMAQQHGGLDPSRRDQAIVDQLGQELVDVINETVGTDDSSNPFRFEFHLLADPKLVNAFALPGGQIFITRALYDRLGSQAQVAGVLGHEIGHVVERHSAERLAIQRRNQGLAGAAGVAGGDIDSARMAQMVANLAGKKYGRNQELESDMYGVKLMAAAGYDPTAMINVMEVLDAAGGGGGPEFLSTHPKPANRIEYIKRVINEAFPNGLPDGLER